MKLQIIETPDYILAVSDEEINHNDYYVSWETSYSTEPKSRWVVYIKVTTLNGSSPKKTIAYQPKGNTPELDLPLLPEMVVEDDVEMLLDMYEAERGSLEETSWEEIQVIKKALLIGYKAATKVYSKEDMRKAFGAGWKRGKFGNYPKEHEQYQPDFTEFIQSLKQPKPKWFVAETELKEVNPNADRLQYLKGLKTTTINGKTYLVGKYLKE